MSSDAGRMRAAHRVEFALSHRATPWVLAAVFVVHGLWSLAGDRHLYDEGLLTYIFASWLRDAPAATLFFQKAKPVTSLVYAPTTWLGTWGFFVAHVLVAASAIPMLGAIARRLELPLPAIPCLLLAASPMYLASAPSGLSNADGVVVIVLFLYVLVCAQRPLLAGILLGCVPWVRYELMLLVIAFGVYAAIWERRMLLGIFVFPLSYALAGAAYHGSLLWPLAFPPAMPRAMPENPVFIGELEGFGVTQVGLTLLAVSPAVLLAPMLRLERLARVERVLLLFAVSYFLAINVLPHWQIFNFGFTPRYSLGLLPALALFSGRVVAGWWNRSEAGRGAIPALVVLYAAGLVARTETAVLLWGAVATTSLLAIQTAGKSRIAASIALLCAVSVVPFLDQAANISVRSRGAHPTEIVRWLSHERSRLGRGPIITDIAILDALLDRSGRVPELEVRYLVGADQAYEITGLTNADNGQRAELLEAMAKTFYGRPILPGQLTPAEVSDDAVFVLSRDERLRLIMKEPIWRDRLRVVAEGERFRIAEMIR